MKRTILTLISAFILSINAHAGDPSATTGSYILLSGMAVSYVVAAPFILLDKLSDNAAHSNQNSAHSNEARQIKVIKVTHQENQKTQIQAIASYDSQNEPFTFEVDTKKAMETQITPGQKLDIKRVNADYLLKANDKPLILIQGKNAQYFKNQKIN